MNEQTKFGKLLSLIKYLVEKECDFSRNVKISKYYKIIYSSSFGNMVKSNLKEKERPAEEIRKFTCLYDKGNK